MKYNFDVVNDRSKTSSIKWNPEFFSGEFNGNKDLLPLWVADMDFAVSEGIIKRFESLSHAGIFGYSNFDDDYYNAVIGWHKNVHSIEYKKEEIIFTPGIVPAINYILQTFTSVGDAVLIQVPVYYPFRNSIVNNDRKLVTTALKESGDMGYTIDFEDMEKKIADNCVKIFILCSPHNPVGRVWTREELKKMIDICVKYNVLILSDEIHCDLLFFGNKYVPGMDVCSKGAQLMITCNAVSKTFNLAGLQISNIIIRNPELREKYKETLKKLSISIPNIFAIEAVKGAYLDSFDWYKQMLAYIEANIVYTSDFFKDNIPAITMKKQEGTYLGWINVKGLNMDNQALENFFEHKAKVALDYGHWFGEEGSGFVRINLACPRSVLIEALNRIKSAVESLPL